MRWKIENALLILWWYLKFNWFTRTIKSVFRIGKWRAAWGINPYEVAAIINKVGLSNIEEMQIQTDNHYTLIYFDPFPDEPDEFFD